MKLRARAWLAAVLIAAAGVLILCGTTHAWVALPATAVAGALALAPESRRRAALRIEIALATAAITLAVADLVARPLTTSLIYYRPDELLLRPWWRLDQVKRFEPGVRFTMTATGDLAALVTDPTVREPREVTVVTDELGFRNEPGTARVPCDLIVLGDSFAAGSGTTQDAIFASVLAASGLRVTNLSIPAQGPWHEYVDLAAELPNVARSPGARAVWLLFPSNDLDDPYGPELELDALPWLGTWDRFELELGLFRERSPFARLATRLRRGRDADARPSAVIARTLPNGKRILFHEPYRANALCSADELARHANLPLLRKTLAATRALADREKLPIDVALAPCKEEIYAWAIDGKEPFSDPDDETPIGRLFADEAERAGFPVLRLKPALRAAARREWARGELLWWSDDTHWNGRGHAAVAAALRERLRPR